MVFSKIKNALSSNSEKYEVLYHKYSRVRLDNKKLREEHKSNMGDFEHNTKLVIAKDMINLYEKIEEMKLNSYKVKAIDQDVQRMMVGVNQTEKAMRKVMSDLEMEEIVAGEKFYDPSVHEIASYTSANGMTVNMILKTVRKGFKFRGKLLKKPRVVVTK